MRFAYADPPYPGQGARHYDGREVNHPLLIQYLTDEFPDGWALSSDEPSLDYVRSLLPEGTRMGIWIKTGWLSYKKGVDIAYAWEPVFWYGGRKYSHTKRKDGGISTIRNWVAAPATRGMGVHGAKPQKFCQFVFDVLHMEPGDEFCDVFPGSGAVTRSWKQFARQSVMQLYQEATCPKTSAPRATHTHSEGHM